MNEYALILLKSNFSFSIHMIAVSKLEQLLNKNYTVLAQTNKSHCTFLYKTLMSSECTVSDTQTGKCYSGTLKKILEVVSKANTSYERVKVIQLDLSLFTAMWLRLTSHFPEFNRSNELIVNAEDSTILVYPEQDSDFSFIIETDNPETPLSFLTLRSVSTNGVVEDIKLLTEQSAYTWNVRYKVSGSTITCIKSEMIDRDKLQNAIAQSRAKTYKYEFASSIEDAIICILSVNFEPKWY